MIPNIAVGPPVSGLPDQLAQNRKPSAEDRSGGSFERTLGEKMKSPEAPRATEPRREAPPKKEAREDREPEAESARAPQATVPRKPTTAREKAIRKFMDSFESEFGIPSTRIVESMAQLDAAQMMKTPEETAELVISDLGLDSESEDKAKMMYLSLLGELQQAPSSAAASMMPLAPTESPVPASVLEQPRVQERFNVAHQRRQALNRSLDELNQKFWMKDRPGLSGLDPALSAQEQQASRAFDRMSPADEALGAELGLSGMASELMDPSMENAPILPEDSFRMPEEGARLRQPGRFPAQQTDENGDMKLMMAAPLAGDQASAMSGRKTLNPREIEAVLAREAAMSSARAATPAQAALGAEAGLEPATLKAFESPTPAPFMVPTGFGKGSSFSSEDSGSDTGGETRGDESALKQAAGLGSATLAKGEFRVEAQAPGAPVPMGQSDSAEKDPNIRQLMNQAQYLIKKGGGEMTVRMTPESLGPVQLKVLVQDGRVSVQMAAESNEAKRAIEGGLSDLKSSLAAHKLSVDHVKVDVVSSANTEMNSRNETNLNSNGQRDNQTRQFWNQFQENFGNRGQREGILEIPGLRGYQQSRQIDPLAPVDSSSGQARQKRADGRGERMDLVA